MTSTDRPDGLTPAPAPAGREAELAERLAALSAKANDALRAVDDLVAQSTGVVGLHLNGDVAPWDELLVGGRFEEWLLPLEALRQALRENTRAGQLAPPGDAWRQGAEAAAKHVEMLGEAFANSSAPQYVEVHNRIAKSIRQFVQPPADAREG